EPDTEVIYKVTNFYSPQHDCGVAWDDPDIGIAWPAAAESVVLSDKDRKWPRLRDLTEVFA
ncbi:MAG: dTDP-4-dehydrorhamnose 3 5-epimerase, partial [Methylocystaceae bacterium]